MLPVAVWGEMSRGTTGIGVRNHLFSAPVESAACDSGDRGDALRFATLLQLDVANFRQLDSAAVDWRVADAAPHFDELIGSQAMRRDDFPVQTRVSDGVFYETE